MTLYIPCSMATGRMQVLTIARSPGIRVLSFANHHRALEAANSMVANTWVYCSRESEYSSHEATGQDDISVWETELDTLVQAGLAVGPDGFGVDSCTFNKATMLVTVVESVDVSVEIDIDSMRARLDMLNEMS